MTDKEDDSLRVGDCPALDNATLVLAFTGWMDGGNVSTGTVERLVDLLGARPIAQIDPEPFYIYNFPGPMEVAALFRPYVEIEDGVLKSIAMPSSTFYCHEPARLVLFVGKEPNLNWRAYRRVHFSPGEAGGGAADSVRRLVRRIGAAHPRAAAVHFLQRRRDAGRDGALRRAAQRLRRAGLVHQLTSCRRPPRPG